MIYITEYIDQCIRIATDYLVAYSHTQITLVRNGRSHSVGRWSVLAILPSPQKYTD